jgi:cytochrome b561
MTSALACAAVKASHQSDAAPSSLPKAYKTFSQSLHWVMSNFFPMICIQRVYCVRERRRVMTHEVPMLVSSLGCVLLLLLVLLVLLILLNLMYRSCKSLQKLLLRYDELIHRGIGWWWWQLLTMLVLVIIET